MGGVPLRFDQLATKEDVDSVIAAALAFCKSAANYHEKYEAAFMDMLQCAFTLSEKEAAEGVREVGRRDEAGEKRLRSMENIRKMSWTKVLRCVTIHSVLSQPNQINQLALVIALLTVIQHSTLAAIYTTIVRDNSPTIQGLPKVFQSSCGQSVFLFPKGTSKFVEQTSVFALIGELMPIPVHANGEAKDLCEPKCSTLFS